MILKKSAAAAGGAVLAAAVLYGAGCAASLYFARQNLSPVLNDLTYVSATDRFKLTYKEEDSGLFSSSGKLVITDSYSSSADDKALMEFPMSLKGGFLSASFSTDLSASFIQLANNIGMPIDAKTMQAELKGDFSLLPWAQTAELTAYSAYDGELNAPAASVHARVHRNMFDDISTSVDLRNLVSADAGILAERVYALGYVQAKHGEVSKPGRLTVGVKNVKQSQLDGAEALEFRIKSTPVNKLGDFSLLADVSGRYVGPFRLIEGQSSIGTFNLAQLSKIPTDVAAMPELLSALPKVLDFKLFNLDLGYMSINMQERDLDRYLFNAKGELKAVMPEGRFTDGKFLIKLKQAPSSGAKNLPFFLSEIFEGKPGQEQCLLEIKQGRIFINGRQF